MKTKLMLCVGILLTMCAWAVHADEITVTFFTTATKTPLGYVTLTDTKDGLLIKPVLTGLSPGIHGLHVHQNPSCEHNGDDAGGHFDPAKSNTHLGPYAHGHQGDLPALYVDAKGKKGSYLTFAQVFRREGQPCSRCGTEIIKIRSAGRGTHLCPRCQKAPRKR